MRTLSAALTLNPPLLNVGRSTFVYSSFMCVRQMHSMSIALILNHPFWISANPPPDLISPWVFVVFVICVRVTNARTECRSDIEPSPPKFQLISICGLVIVRVINAVTEYRLTLNPPLLTCSDSTHVVLSFFMCVWQIHSLSVALTFNPSLLNISNYTG